VEKRQRRGGHTASWMTVHIVWVTEYRYHVLKDNIQIRCRDLIKQVCDGEDVRILKGAISKDHVHIHVEYPPKLGVGDFVKRLKGRTSRKLQQEYTELGKRYWGRHFRAIGYGAWSSGNITDDMVQEYLEHHKNQDDTNNDDAFILEK